MTLSRGVSSMRRTSGSTSSATATPRFSDGAAAGSEERNEKSTRAPPAPAAPAATTPPRGAAAGSEERNEKSPRAATAPAAPAATKPRRERELDTCGLLRWTERARREGRPGRARAAVALPPRGRGGGGRP